LVVPEACAGSGFVDAARQTSRHRASQPWLPQDVRQRLLDAAGLNQDRQADLLRKAVEQAENALEATVPVVSPTGGIIEWRPDWFGRLKAVSFLTNLLGAAPSKSASATHRWRGCGLQADDGRLPTNRVRI
jgi:hypothetical protein